MLCGGRQVTRLDQNFPALAVCTPEFYADSRRRLRVFGYQTSVFSLFSKRRGASILAGWIHWVIRSPSARRATNRVGRAAPKKVSAPLTTPAAVSGLL